MLWRPNPQVSYCSCQEAVKKGLLLRFDCDVALEEEKWKKNSALASLKSRSWYFLPFETVKRMEKIPNGLDNTFQPSGV